MRKIEIIRSDRKTISILIRRDLQIVVRAPRNMQQADIDKFVAGNEQWIEDNLLVMKKRNQDAAERGNNLVAFSEEEISELANRALELIPPRTDYFAEIMGVEYRRIVIRNQVSRWGSCSPRKNLNFNCLLMLCPSDVVDYVIIHELAHLKHMDHSKEFWAMVESFCPNYKVHKNWLKNEGEVLIERMRKTRNFEI